MRACENLNGSYKKKENHHMNPKKRQELQQLEDKLTAAEVMASGIELAKDAGDFSTKDHCDLMHYKRMIAHYQNKIKLLKSSVIR